MLKMSVLFEGINGQAAQFNFVLHVKSNKNSGEIPRSQVVNTLAVI
jgi:hypothetical protein